MAGVNRGLQWINALHKAGFSLHRVVGIYFRLVGNVLPTLYYLCINYI